MNAKQTEQFNRMRAALKLIGTEFQTVNQLRRDAEQVYGLPYEEALENAYETIQREAKAAVKGVKIAPVSP